VRQKEIPRAFLTETQMVRRETSRWQVPDGQEEGDRDGLAEGDPDGDDDGAA
jgi:hypothetical protein